VTGKLGGPAAALRSLLSGGQADEQSRARFARPFARIEEGMWLAAHGATSAIDVSDGLIADARHVAAASGVALAVDLDLVPTLAASSAADAAASGEEYELLVTAPATIDARAFAAMFQLPLTRIGEVRALREARGVRDAPGVVVTAGGARVEFTAGHDHFSA
jgi:thiamine-monophosphate kinase